MNSEYHFVIPGDTYKVIYDSEHVLHPGTLIVPLEDANLFYCVLKKDYVPGQHRKSFYRDYYIMEAQEVESVESESSNKIKVKDIEISVSTNRVGSEVKRYITVPVDTTEEEISELAWEIALDMINFTWREP